MPRTKHMLSKSFAYASWVGMRERCQNPKNISYPFYGAKGITVCERWQTFENFYADMGEREAGYSIDRIDNNGNYEPSNCRWATDAEQGANKTNVKIHSAFGVTTHIAEHVRKHGVGRDAVNYRLSKGLSMEQALTKPSGQRLPYSPKTQCLRGHRYAEHAKLGNDGRYHCTTCAKISRRRKTGWPEHLLDAPSKHAPISKGPTIEIDAEKYKTLVESHLRLRDKLNEYAKECLGCDGAGVVTIHGGSPAAGLSRERVEPCPVCHDLRELLE